VEAILKFYEDLSFDDRHLWAIYADFEIQWQVSWNRKNQPEYWNFVRQIDRASFQMATAEVAPFLLAQDIDEDQFRQTIVESILTMSCFAETFQQNVRKLLGEEIVDGALRQFADFSEKILEMTNRETSQNRPELKVLRD
jgi:hypothetical protein